MPVSAPEKQASPRAVGAHGAPSPSAPPNAALGDSSALVLVHILGSDGISSSDRSPGHYKCSPPSQVFLTTVLSLSEQIEGHQATNPALQVLPGCLACRNALLLSTDIWCFKRQGPMLISF